jgi:hypothetical protein
VNVGLIGDSSLADGNYVEYVVSVAPVESGVTDEE